MLKNSCGAGLDNRKNELVILVKLPECNHSNNIEVNKDEDVNKV